MLACEPVLCTGLLCACVLCTGWLCACVLCTGLFCASDLWSAQMRACVLCTGWLCACVLCTGWLCACVLCTGWLCACLLVLVLSLYWDVANLFQHIEHRVKFCGRVGAAAWRSIATRERARCADAKCTEEELQLPGEAESE